MGDMFAAAKASTNARREATAASVIAELLFMGATRTYITDRAVEREVQIEHPELPGVLIIPITGELLTTTDDELVGHHIVDTLALALVEERNTPHGD
jgi:hypothetical protein